MIVSKHIQMQHSTGLYERLKNLDTPEDIQKWREERRKRYPTKANIELRQQMQEERNKRGEKLNNSKARFGRQSDRRRCNNNSTDRSHPAPDTNGRVNSQNKGREGKKKRRRPNKKVVEQPTGEDDKDESNQCVSNNGLPMFRGTSQLKNYKKRKEIQPKNALSSLLGAYESDSNSNESSSEDEESSDDMDCSTAIVKSPVKSDTDSIAEVEIKVDSSREQSSAVNEDHEDVSYEDNDEMICDSELPDSSVGTIDADNDLDELPNEERILKMEEDVAPLPPTEGPSASNRRTTSKVLDKRLSKRPTVLDLSKKYRNQNTMLGKLLQNEIRHERNVLLQCVRHVVKGNFFGIGQKATSASITE